VHDDELVRGATFLERGATLRALTKAGKAGVIGTSIDMIRRHLRANDVDQW
jgi:hypothetical protein